MSDQSAIEWTDATWNPTTGCTKVSPACANCYIERTPPFRIRGRKFVNGHIPLELHANRLDQPKKWAKPRRIFVNSLSDLFHHDVPDSFVYEVYRTMAKTPQHIYQVLTKRPERMCRLVNTIRGHFPDRLDHVWHGVSAENQRMYDERIPWLMKTRSRVHFVSMEPLLSRVDLRLDTEDALCGPLNWVIVGGESGAKLRPTDPAWVRDIRDQCVTAGAAFFFKQWGGKTAKAGGRDLDGRTWDEMPLALPPAVKHWNEVSE